MRENSGKLSIWENTLVLPQAFILYPLLFLSLLPSVGQPVAPETLINLSYDLAGCSPLSNSTDFSFRAVEDVIQRKAGAEK